MDDLVNDAPRTRRALLAAAAAAGAATMAGAFAKPLTVRGATDDNADMFVGTVYGDVSVTTGLMNHTNGTTVFSANSSFGTAVLGTSSSTSGGAGVYGVNGGGSAGSAGIGVRAAGGIGRGVVAETSNNIAVHAFGNTGTAVRAETTSGIGVHVTTDSNMAIYAVSDNSLGAYVYSGAPNVPAVQVLNGGGSVAVYGHAGDGGPDAQANTGVQGSANGAGTGGHFSSPSGNALRVVGKASFSRAGRVNVPAGKSYVDVTVSGGLASSAAVVATLQIPRGTACVTSVRVNYPSAGKARIYLNKVASTTAATPVGFFVIG